MQQAALLVEQFEHQSFLELGKVLTDAEVAKYERGYEHNRRAHAAMWREIGRETHQTGNMGTLESWPEVDGLVRHPRILPTVRALMGGACTLALLQLTSHAST